MNIDFLIFTKLNVVPFLKKKKNLMFHLKKKDTAYSCVWTDKLSHLVVNEKTKMYNQTV